VITIELNKRWYEIPTSWNELSQKQVLQIMTVLYLRKYKAEQQLLRLVQALTGLNNYGFFKCSVDEVAEYFYLLAFLVDDKFEFTTNLIPKYQGKKGPVLYGPTSELENQRMSEFTIADGLFNQWFEDKENEQLLNELVATLYRPGIEGYNF
jgi:hypothetical protein